MILTPEQIAYINQKWLAEIPQPDDRDTEGTHADADATIIEILTALGLTEIVAAYAPVAKWY